MRITKIFLKNYAPMALNEFESIEITIDKPTTLILGTNGSGKSSLLRICTPLPVPMGEFKENGEMILDLDYNGNSYSIISTYKRSARYNLVKNGVTLHENVTGALHRDVVIKEFGYTQLMHRVLIGDILFTEMKPGERKEVLMAICPVELKYVSGLYRDAKTALRDTMGAIKHISAKRSEIITKLQNLDVPTGLEEERVEIEAALQQILPFVNNELESPVYFNELIENDYNKLKAIKKHLERFNDVRVPDVSLNSISSLNEYVGSCNGQITLLQKQITENCNTLEDISATHNGLASSDLTIEEILFRKECVETSLASIVDDCYTDNNHKLYISNIDDILALSNAVRDSLNDTTVLTMDRDAILREHEELHNKMTAAKYAVTRLEEKIEHHTKDLVMGVCPKCEHTFNLSGGNTEEIISSTKERLKNAESFLVANIKRYEELCKQQEMIIEYKSMISSIKGLWHVYKMPYEFWGELTAHQILSDGTAFIQHSQAWKTNLMSGYERKALLDELSSINNAIDFHNKYSSDSEQQLQKLQTLLESLMTEQDCIKKQRDLVGVILRNMELFTKYENESGVLLARIDSNFEHLTDAAINDEAKGICSKLYSKLSADKVILDKWNSLTDTLKGLDKEYETLMHKQNAWQLLVDNFSPTTGVIADQMLGFIDNYMQQMNGILKNIFSYSLKIENCDMDNGVLDYTFPLTAEFSTVKDINMGSKGQKEIVNMAFMLVMRHYLNLNNFPLFLDETGAGFDKRHRDNLMLYIKKVLQDGLCSQLFFVNHYSDMHGGLVNHDTVVLNPNNIVAPFVHNTNVVITYK